MAWTEIVDPEPTVRSDLGLQQGHGSRRSLLRVRSGLGRRAIPEALDQPCRVVPLDELSDDPPRLVQALELMQVDALLLEGPHEALGDPVALWFADVGRRDGAAQPLHFVDPGVGDVLRAPVAADRQAAGDILAEPSEGVADALADGFEGGPAVA